MTGIIHNQRTIGLVLLDFLGSFWVSVSRWRWLAFVSIPHHLFNNIARMCGWGFFRRFVYIVHVDVLIAVVAHENQHVLPRTSIGILNVTDGFVYHDFRFAFRGNGESTYSHIQLIWTHGIGTFTIVKQGIETIVYVTMDFVEWVLAFIAEQVIIGSSGLPVACVHAVIPCTITEKQQVFRHIVLFFCTVVQHFQILTISIGIRCSSAKLIDEFIGRNDTNA